MTASVTGERTNPVNTEPVQGKEQRYEAVSRREAAGPSSSPGREGDALSAHCMVKLCSDPATRGYTYDACPSAQTHCKCYLSIHRLCRRLQVSVCVIGCSLESWLLIGFAKVFRQFAKVLCRWAYRRIPVRFKCHAIWKTAITALSAPLLPEFFSIWILAPNPTSCSASWLSHYRLSLWAHKQLSGYSQQETFVLRILFRS